VLDAGALIAFERNHLGVRRLVELALERRQSLHVPAGVVAQVWRDGRRQARLATLLASDLVVVHPLDLDEARGAGALCGLKGSAGVVDASVVILARRLEPAVVVTSDPEDLSRLDPRLELAVC
jgi:hypothetical protein